MDYEKGKKIENVEYKLSKLINGGYDGNEKEKSLFVIYDRIDEACRELREVLRNN